MVFIFPKITFMHCTQLNSVFTYGTWGLWWSTRWKGKCFRTYMFAVSKSIFIGLFAVYWLLVIILLEGGCILVICTEENVNLINVNWNRVKKNWFFCVNLLNSLQYISPPKLPMSMFVRFPCIPLVRHNAKCVPFALVF